MIAKKHWWAIALAVILAGCGGGDNETAISPQTVSTVMQAEAQAMGPLSERQEAVSANDAANQMLDFAESRFPAYFPARTSNSVLGPLLFRYYPQTQMYVGVGIDSGGGVAPGNVYVMGGGFGSRPIYVGHLTSFITPVACSTSATTLTLGVPLRASATLACDAIFRVNIPAGQGQLLVTAFSGPTSGNSVLYVRQGQLPTATNFACRADFENVDVCEMGDAFDRNTFPAAGDWYIRVVGAVTNVEVTARVFTPIATTPITRLTSGVPLSNRVVSLKGHAYFEVSVPIGSTRLEVRTSGGTGDGDLFIGRGNTPATMNVECSSEAIGNTDSCVINNPVAGTWYVDVLGYEAVSGMSIVATVNGSSTTPTPPSTGTCTLSSPFKGTWALGQGVNMKIGCIAGEPQARVYYCYTDGTRRVLQKGSLRSDGITVDWDAGVFDPVWILEPQGTSGMQAYVPSINNISFGYVRASWTAGACGFSF